MMTLEAYYDNDNCIVTDFSGDYDDAIRHYLGRKHVFDYGEREEMATCERIFFHGNETHGIYMECAYVRDGEAWYEINRDTGYRLDGKKPWTVADARKDYTESVRRDTMNESMRKCMYCEKEVQVQDMLWTHDCHGIAFRKVCLDCYDRIMEEKGYDGEYYTEADECIDYDY